MIAIATTIFAVLSLNMAAHGAILPYQIVAVGLDNQADPESNDTDMIKEKEEDLEIERYEETKSLLEIQTAASIIERILLKKRRQNHRIK